MMLPKGHTENGSGRPVLHAIYVKPASGGDPGRDDSPTWTVWTVARRILLPVAILPARAPYSSVTSDPAGTSYAQTPCGHLLGVRVQRHVRPVAVVSFPESGERIRLYGGKVDLTGGVRRLGSSPGFGDSRSEGSTLADVRRRQPPQRLLQPVRVLWMEHQHTHHGCHLAHVPIPGNQGAAVHPALGQYVDIAVVRHLVLAFQLSGMR